MNVPWYGTWYNEHAVLNNIIHIGIASTLQLGGPHIAKDEMQVEDQLSMLNWGVLP